MKTVRYLVVPALVVAAWIAVVGVAVSSFSGLAPATEAALANSHPSSVAYQLSERADDSRVAAANQE